jgi:hypothetical protein
MQLPGPNRLDTNPNATRPTNFLPFNHPLARTTHLPATYFEVALILISTPAGRLNLFKASIVLAEA